MAVVVYPVPGMVFRSGSIPSAPLETDAATANRLVRTGGFTKTKPAGEQPEPIPYEAGPDLDFYDNPRGHDHDKAVHGRDSAQAVPIVAAPESTESEES